MAKTTPRTAEKQKTTALIAQLVTQNEAALATRNVASDTFAPMEGFNKDDRSGKEGITNEDLRLPFISIAQMTSKAKDETDDAYIPGIKLGDLYNSETKELYGRGPVFFLSLRLDKWAYLPDENGRIGEKIAWDDPRCAWPTEEEKKAWTGKGKPKPEGVRVMSYTGLILTDNGPQLAIVSFKSKSFASGQSLATFIKMVQGPSYTAKFGITSQVTENEAGKFGKLAVTPAGKPTLEDAQFAQKMYDTIKDRKIVLEGDDTPDVIEGETVAAQPAKTDDKIPF